MRSIRNRGLRTRGSRTRGLKTRSLRTRKYNGGKKGNKKTGKKWTTAIDAAQKTLYETGDIEAAKKTLRMQALNNARKLFGSINSI
jgi:hypothetical protein